MKVGILGGTRFIGPFIVRELVEKGHQVEVYHRGQTPGELPEGVGHVTVDRSIPGQTRAALEEHRPEAVIDMCGCRPGQVRGHELLYGAGRELRSQCLGALACIMMPIREHLDA